MLLKIWALKPDSNIIVVYPAKGFFKLPVEKKVKKKKKMSRVILLRKNLRHDGKFFLVKKTPLSKLQLENSRFLFFLLRFDFFGSNLRK